MTLLVVGPCTHNREGHTSAPSPSSARHRFLRTVRTRRWPSVVVTPFGDEVFVYSGCTGARSTEGTDFRSRSVFRNFLFFSLWRTGVAPLKSSTVPPARRGARPERGKETPEDFGRLEQETSTLCRRDDTLCYRDDTREGRGTGTSRRTSTRGSRSFEVLLRNSVLSEVTPGSFPLVVFGPRQFSRAVDRGRTDRGSSV